MSHSAYIALGSNIGDHRDTLNRALAMLDESPRVEVVRVSRFVDTEPIGPPQGRYTNAAARLATDLEPHELLDLLQAVEAALGRDRTSEQRWGPRTCDLDILLFDDLRIDDERLTVPHPRMHERMFVLGPLAEIAPDVAHPGLGRTVRQLRDALGGSTAGEALR